MPVSVNGEIERELDRDNFGPFFYYFIPFLDISQSIIRQTVPAAGRGDLDSIIGHLSETSEKIII